MYRSLYVQSLYCLCSFSYPTDCYEYPREEVYIFEGVCSISLYSLQHVYVLCIQVPILRLTVLCYAAERMGSSNCFDCWDGRD